MTQRVKVKVRPNQPLRFPGICVHCAQPASEWLGLRRQIGRVARLIDVPLCADCARELRRQSGEEERRQKLGWLISGLVFILALALGLLFTSAALGFWLRLLLALALALLLGTAVFSLFRRLSDHAALPAKKAIRTAVVMADFSWQVTTFTFTNETFANRFRQLNESLLLES